MSIGDNAAVARAWAQAAWQQHDLDAATRFLASDWIGHTGRLVAPVSSDAVTRQLYAAGRGER